MSYKYFHNIKTPEEAKEKYIELVKKYHPDKNPELAEEECNNITSKIIIEYKKLLNELDNPPPPPKPNEERGEKDEPHKSSVSDFYSIQKGKTRLKSKKKQIISRKQAKRGIDWLFDGIELLNELRK